MYIKKKFEDNMIKQERKHKKLKILNISNVNMRKYHNYKDLVDKYNFKDACLSKFIFKI